MCDIIIPVWNGLESTKRCIDSLERNTLYPYRLVIIDNGSDRPTAQFLEGLKGKSRLNILLIRNSRNEGFIRAVNKGISSSTSEYVCILNNDTIVTRRWLTGLIDVINRDPLIAIVNPSSNTLGQKLPKGVSPEEYATSADAQNGLFVEIGSALGFCMLVKRTTFSELGLFDEGYGMGNFEDTDFSMRAKQKGYKVVRALKPYVYHREHGSFNFLKNFKRDFDRNKRRFESKWGRRKRIMIVVGNSDLHSMEYLKGAIKEYANANSWVYVVSPFFKTKTFYEYFSDLTFYHPRHLLYIYAFFKIFFKKKKPDIIFSDNMAFSRFLNAFKLLHGAEVKNIG